MIEVYITYSLTLDTLHTTLSVPRQSRYRRFSVHLSEKWEIVNIRRIRQKGKIVLPPHPSSVP